jgi:hypothetical protein
MSEKTTPHSKKMEKAFNEALSHTCDEDFDEDGLDEIERFQIDDECDEDDLNAILDIMIDAATKGRHVFFVWTRVGSRIFFPGMSEDEVAERLARFV